MVPEIKESIVLDKLAQFDIEGVYGKSADGKMSGLQRYKMNEEQAFDELNHLWVNSTVLSASLGAFFVVCYSLYEHSNGSLPDALMISFICLAAVIFGLCRELVSAKRSIACMRWNSTVMSIANGLYDASLSTIIRERFEEDGEEIVTAAKVSTQSVMNVVAKSVTEELKEEYDIREDD